ncbi:rho GTPase-activating protein 40 isoform X3 [Salmo salar]|uniref:Rho GTPase-activating protein 40 isoform X3 n=1 Tax=Salmo salar TaxID=8030 RepID=A0ABM3CMS8_SALSA|nr:rho GTPase-activating protein 40 isoform X3 [Salmo salar]
MDHPGPRPVERKSLYPRSPSPSEMNGEPWARPRYQDQAAAEHCIASHQEQQQHPDKLCLDSFWSEVETIRSQGSGYTDLDTDSARRDSRHSEEGEQEERWLQDAGLSTLIRHQQQRPDRDRDRDTDSEDQDVDQAILLSTLTRTQAAAVQRRLDSYTLSLRKRSKPQPRDVRDVFSSSQYSIAQTPLPECQDPEPIEPKSSLLECQDPEPIEPKSSLLECQDPEPIEPKSSLLECKDPEPIEPKSSLLECQDPEPIEPKSSLLECQDPEPTEPKSSLLECQDPEPIEPKSSLLECQDPEPIEPKSSLLECQDPEPIEPKSSLLECQDPEPIEPKSSLLECKDPEPIEPKSSLLECQDPEPIEPKSSLLECQDPEPIEPKSSLLECQDPEPTEPKSSLLECQDPEPIEPKSSLLECQDPEPIEPKSSLLDDSMETINKTPLQEVSLHQQKKHGGAPKEEIFITDVAYCEQAAILIKQAKLPQIKNSCKRKEDGTLPRVICPQCRLGVTRIQDLSNQDMKKVRQLALIDMTALCDLLELDVKRHKTCKRKIPESALFGVPLATLLENDQKVKPTATTPLILQALLWFLEKRGVDSEGILRVSGSQSRIKKLQQDLEQNFYSGGFSWDEVSPNDVAALLKRFIRELPSPLLTAEHLNTFSAARDIPELKQKLHVLNLLILLLPEPNRNTLKALLEFLSKVVSRERRNRMNLWAVATIMAPNLFLFLHKAVPSRLTDGGPGVEKGHTDKAPNLLLHKAVPSRLTDWGPGEEKGHAEKAADIMRLLIRYQDLLWTIPNFLMSQVRKLNENSNRRYQFCDRRIKNLLRKIHQDRKGKPDKNSSEPCRTVKIQVGELMSSTMEVKVNINSRASDLLAQFYRHLYSSDNTKGLLKRNGLVNDLGSYPDCAMYEVGGNIGEHCLDPEAYLLDLYNNNPSGEWVIKQKPLTTSRGLQI